MMNGRWIATASGCAAVAVCAGCGSEEHPKPDSRTEVAARVHDQKALVRALSE
jgi:hypothetical protein